MLDDDHIPSQLPEEPSRGLSRGLVVGAYEGLRAGQAIVAVRELGLRPCLERVEGYEAGLHGFVVSQEPSSGTQVTVDSQVFLYVAAPARTIVQRGPEDGGHHVISEASNDADGDDSTGDIDSKEDADNGPAERTDDFAERDFGGEAEDNQEEHSEDDAEDLRDEESLEEQEQLYHGSEGAGGSDGFEPSLEEETRELGGVDSVFAREGELAEDPEVAEEPVEPVRVWRGPPPGALPRRRLTRRHSSRRQRAWPQAPLSLQLGIALLVCVGLVVLVSLASPGHSSSRDAQHPRPTVSQARSGSARSMLTPPRTVGARPAVSRPVFSGPTHRRRSGGEVRRARTTVPSPSPVAPPAASVPAAAPAPSSSAVSVTGTAAEEQAIREFGP